MQIGFNYNVMDVQRFAHRLIYYTEAVTCRTRLFMIYTGWFTVNDLVSGDVCLNATKNVLFTLVLHKILISMRYCVLTGKFFFFFFAIKTRS